MRQHDVVARAREHVCSWGATLAIVAALFGTSPAPAGAQSADELIEQGIAQRRAGDDPGALATFQRAYESAPSPRAAAQLGLVHQALGQWVEAHTRLNEALAAASDAWVTRNRPALEQALAVVESEVGTVEVLVSGALPPGTRATLGAREIASFPMTRPIVVVAGEEALVVSAPGHGTVRRDVRVRAGQLSRVTVELRPETSTAAAGAERAATGEPEPTEEPGAGSTETSASAAAGSTGTAGPTDSGGGGDDWIAWVIVGAALVVGGGVVIGVVAGQQSLEPPRPGTLGAVELLRF